MVASEKYRLQLLGPFGLFQPNGERIEIKSRKSIALIALLALAPDGLRTRTWLQAILWENRETQQAQASLRRELSNLSKALRSVDAEHLLLRESQRVHLSLDHIDVDIFDIKIGVTARASRASCVFLEGLDLAGCEAFEDWLRIERERLVEISSVDIPDTKPQPNSGLSSEDQSGLSSDAVLNDGPIPMPPRPSVAVMPFMVLPNNESDNEWIGVGIAEEIGMMLSQFPQLFVVAAGSAASLAERGHTHSEIASQLGVRYLLGGILRRNGEATRISVNLMFGATGEHVWSHSIDGTADDLFELPEKVALLAAPQIWTQIDTSERKRSLLRRSSKLSNYERYWRANALFRTWSRDSVLEAISIADEMIVEAPTCPFASALAGFCNGVAYALSWTQNKEATRRAAIGHYQNALRFGDSNVEVLGYVAGTLVCIGGDMELADRLINHAHMLLPRFQPTLFWGGWVDLANGNPKRACERFELALRVNPASGSRPYATAGIGIAKLLENEAKVALEYLRRAVLEIPYYPPAQAALFAAATLAGDERHAQESADALQHMNIESALSVFRDSDQRNTLMQALNAKSLKIALP